MEESESLNQKQKRNVGPARVLDYLNPHYWDERFSKEEHYEWFKDYSHFRHLILQHVNHNSSVLELGCGNSQLCEDLYSDGIREITCIDLSAVAVKKMKERFLSKGYKEIKVLEADMLDLPFSNECFDVVIEKGTMDVLFVDSGDPWNPHAETVAKVMSMLQNVHRVLKSGGIFISITFGQPHFRRPFFEAPEFSWSMEWSTFGDGFHYFFYTLKKIASRVGKVLEIYSQSTLKTYNGNMMGMRSLDDKVSSKKLQVPSIHLLHEELEGEDFLFHTNVEELNC